MRNRNVVIGNRRVLAGILAVTLLLFPVVAFTTGTLRVVLALPFLLFFPGYTLLSALFPRQSDLDTFRRMALSVCLSVVVLPILGLVLNYTPWGIRPLPFLVGVSLFILATSAIAWRRQQRLREAKRLRFTVGTRSSGWTDMGGPNKVLAIVLLVAILTAAVSLGYALTGPAPGDRYTEFHIMGPEGEAAEYPRETRAEQPVYVTLVIINHEHEPTAYRVDIVTGDETIRSLSTGTLRHDEEWQTEADFVLNVPGDNQKIEFRLYADGSSEPYFDDPPYIYMDVR